MAAATVIVMVSGIGVLVRLGPASDNRYGTSAANTVPVQLVPTIAPPTAPPGAPGDGDIVPEVHVPVDQGYANEFAAVGSRAGFAPLVPSSVPAGLSGPFIRFENGNGDERLRDFVSATWTGPGGKELRLLQSRSRVHAEQGLVETNPGNPHVSTTAVTINGANGYRRVGVIGEKTLMLIVLFRDGLRIEIFSEFLAPAEVDAFAASL